MGSAYALVYCEPDFPRINVFFKIISKTKIFNYTELHSVCQMDTFPCELNSSHKKKLLCWKLFDKS